MAEMKMCENCMMEFDWPGVEVRGYEYCCEPCSNGEECICPQHNHQYTTQQPLNQAAANQLGATESS